MVCMADRLHKLVLLWMLIAPGMGGEASLASDSPHGPCSDQSSAGSTPRITLINQSCVVSTNTDTPTCQRSADKTGSRT
jgi:hypothetical protein